MSPSGRLYLFTIVGLILTTRGQTEEATSISLADTTTVNLHAVTQTPDTVRPELPTSTLQASVEATAAQTQTQTQHPTGVDVPLTTAPGTEATFPADPTKGTTPSKQSPDQDPAPRTTGSNEDDPFSYDEATLRKRAAGRSCAVHHRHCHPHQWQV